MYLPPFLVLNGGKETKESQAPAGGIFFVRRRSGWGGLAGMDFFYLLGR